MSYDQRPDFNNVYANLEYYDNTSSLVLINNDDSQNNESTSGTRNKVLLSDKISLLISKMKKKITYSKLSWIFFLFLLFSIVTTSVVFVAKNHFQPSKNEIASETNYEQKFEGVSDKLIYRELKRIDKINLYENLTTWADKREKEIFFKKEMIDKNIIKAIRPYITNDVGENNYFQVRYKLENKWKLLLDIRWCRKQGDKLVGDVYKDYLELNLNQN